MPYLSNKPTEDILERLRPLGEKAFVIGEIVKTEKGQELIEFV